MHFIAFFVFENTKNKTALLKLGSSTEMALTFPMFKECKPFRSGKKRKKPETEKAKKPHEDGIEKPNELNKKKKDKGIRDDGFGDLPSKPKKRMQDGFAIYTEEELGTNKADAGSTQLCPFDCSCCF
ncbi:hypothetical protein ACE6H2_004196 [Prunus campanulata]